MKNTTKTKNKKEKRELKNETIQLVFTIECYCSDNYYISQHPPKQIKRLNEPKAKATVNSQQSVSQFKQTNLVIT